MNLDHFWFQLALVGLAVSLAPDEQPVEKEDLKTRKTNQSADNRCFVFEKCLPAKVSVVCMRRGAERGRSISTAPSRVRRVTKLDVAVGGRLSRDECSRTLHKRCFMSKTCLREGLTLQGEKPRNSKVYDDGNLSVEE